MSTREMKASFVISSVCTCSRLCFCRPTFGRAELGGIEAEALQQSGHLSGQPRPGAPCEAVVCSGAWLGENGGSKGCKPHRAACQLPGEDKSLSKLIEGQGQALRIADDSRSTCSDIVSDSDCAQYCSIM